MDDLADEWNHSDDIIGTLEEMGAKVLEIREGAESAEYEFY